MGYVQWDTENTAVWWAICNVRYGSLSCLMGYVQWDMEAGAVLKITNLPKEYKI